MIETLEVAVRKLTYQKVAWFGSPFDFAEMFDLPGFSGRWYSRGPKGATIRHKNWDVDFYYIDTDPDSLRGMRYDLAYYPDNINDGLKETINCILVCSRGKRIILKEAE